MPGYVQSTKNAVAHTATISATFSSNNTAGNLLVVACGIWTNPLSVTVSDTQGNTYVGYSVLSGTSSGAFIWYAANCAGGPNTVTVTKAVNANQDMDLVIAEYSGYSVLDTVGSNSSSGSNSTTVSLTLASVNELLVSFSYDQSHNNQTWTLSPSTGWTLRQQTSNSDGAESALWDQIYSGSGAYTLTSTLSAGSTALETIVLAFGVGVPSIAISPASGKQGDTATVTVTGTNTHFATGTTTVSVSGSGITVGTITVASATSLTVAITIGATAATGARTMTVTTGSEVPTASFTVTAGVFERGHIDYDQIRLAARQGYGSKFQMFGTGTPVSGHAAVYDASGNVVDGGASPGTGTVTSVGLTMPAEFTVGSSPVTSSGTLAVTKANENANTVWAGPSSGGAAAPAFRALAAADVPVLTKVNGSNLAVNTPNYSDATPSAPSGFVNIKFQSDASGNVSAYDPVGSWANWTPTINASGSMTCSSTTITVAKFLRIGPIVYFYITFSTTLGGTAGTAIGFTLPVTSVGGTDYHGCFAHGTVAGVAQLLACYVYYSGSQGQVYMPAMGNWALGAVSNIRVSGFYECI